MPEYRENELCYEDYRALRTLAGWENHSEEQTRRALAAALYDVTAVEDGRAVAMGRLVGDGLYDVIAGVVVAPEYQGRGIGKAVAEDLLAHAGLLRAAVRPVRPAAHGFCVQKSYCKRKTAPFRAAASRGTGPFPYSAGCPCSTRRSAKPQRPPGIFRNPSFS